MVRLHSLILELSKKITDRTQCTGLGNELKLKSNVIQGAITYALNSGEPMSTAAYKLMSKKKQNMKSEKEVRDELEKAFQEIEMDGEFDEVERILKEKEEKEQEQRSGANGESGSGAAAVDAEVAKVVPTTSSTTSGIDHQITNTDVSSQMQGPPPQSSSCDYADSPSIGAEAIPPEHGGDGLAEATRFKVPDPPGIQRYRKKKYVGKAVVFNIFPDLKGADKDEERILEVLPKLGFRYKKDKPDDPENDVYVYSRSSYADLENALKEVASKDYTEYGCVLIWILSHGTESGVATLTQLMPYKNILQPFKDKESLGGKAKITFIETCHGSGREYGHEIERQKVFWPLEADQFIFYAAPSGYAALVHPVSGSRFTQCLCTALEEWHDQAHLNDISIMVKHMVADINVASGRKQVPMVESTQTKNFFF